MLAGAPSNHSALRCLLCDPSWNALTPSFKMGVVTGFTLAMITVADTTEIRVHSPEEWRQTSGEGTVRSRFKRLYGPRPKCLLGFRKIKMGQLKEGVDMFYSDFPNKAIEIEFALAYLRGQLERKSS